MRQKAALVCTLVILVAIIAALSLALLGGNFADVEPPQPTAEVVFITPSPTPTPIPTPTPTSTPESPPTPTPEPETYVLSFVGDCTIASSQHHKGTTYAYETVVGEDYAFPFARTIEYFENDYLTVVNLESVFTTAEESNGGTFVFKSDPVYANVLKKGSVEMVVLGNNHANDFLTQGHEDTKAALDAVGVCYAADNDWYIYQQGDGLKVGVYSKLYPTVDDVAAGVTALKEAGAELIVAGLHWGIEGSYQLTLDQQTVGHAAIDAGAHIVYGSHPHVLQRMEEYNGGHIFYSLGNWSFGGNTAPRDRDTAIIQIRVHRAFDGSITLGEISIIPGELSSAVGYNNYQPYPYEESSEGYARAISKLDGSFVGADLEIDYSAFHEDGSKIIP